MINVENPFRETEYQVEVFCAKLLQISDCRVELVMDVLFLKTQTIGAGYQRYMLTNTPKNVLARELTEVLSGASSSHGRDL